MSDPQINAGGFGGAGTAPPILGFWGKLPSRGDFLGVGLSKAFVNAWDAWVSASLAASQAAMGEDWQPAWMEAPVWCFRASAGYFGADPVSGLWMPSVDRAGRMFPLLIAAEGGAGAAWFLQAEDAGRAALAENLGPDALAALLPQPTGSVHIAPGTQWWTEGAPRVAACRRVFAGLPPAEDFVLMLKDI
jgi:type VI secretion system protein ImpM